MSPPSPKHSRRIFLKTALVGAMAAGAACAGSRSEKPSGVSTALSTSAPSPPAATVVPSPTPIPATLEEKLGQLLLVGFTGTRFESGSYFADTLASGRIGSVVLFGDNVQSPGQLAELTGRLQQAAPRKLLVAMDQEGGAVARLTPDKGFPATVSEEYLGSRDLSVTRSYAGTMATALAAAGVNLNLAPVVDLNINPQNPVIGAYGRSFSASPQLVTDHARAFIDAHHGAGVLTTLKHFPGHGSSTTDSHDSFVDVTKTWSKSEIEPYRALINAGVVDAVMTAHVFNSSLDSEFPATLSRRTIQGLLREELRYDGVVIADDLQMAAISSNYGYQRAVELAINAGVDVISIAIATAHPNDLAAQAFAAMHSGVLEGRIAMQRVNDAYRRVLTAKNRLATTAVKPPAAATP